MSMFRRTGSVACYRHPGSGPAPLGDEFMEALAAHRFRTIEDAASEETSVGWVSAEDASGGTFDRDDLDCDGQIWLRMRIDKKSAPAKWLQIYRQAEERAAGRRLSAKERKELREDLLARFMPRVLPAIALVDALYCPRRKLVMLFASSAAAQEAFLSLVYKTFGVSLEALGPYARAELIGESGDALAALAPVRWPSAKEVTP